MPVHGIDKLQRGHSWTWRPILSASETEASKQNRGRRKEISSEFPEWSILHCIFVWREKDHRWLALIFAEDATRFYVDGLRRDVTKEVS